MLNRLDMLRIFCAASEARNFKEAARQLGISPQAVTRAVKALEEQVGELLFHRNTRGSRITSFGEQLAARSRASLHEIDHLFARSAPDQGREVTGIVRIASPYFLGQRCLVPMLGALRRDYPGLRIELRLSDQIADVVDEQIDMGVRIGFLRDNRFVARAVARMDFSVLATPEVIATYGEPGQWEDLENLPVTVAIDPNTGKPWPWFNGKGQQWIPQQPVFSTNDTDAEFAAILAGVGFGQTLSFAAQPYIRSGRLREVLASDKPPPWDLFVYRPQRGPMPARVRIVYDRLIACFSDPAVFPPAAPR